MTAEQTIDQIRDVILSWAGDPDDYETPVRLLAQVITLIGEYDNSRGDLSHLGRVDQAIIDHALRDQTDD